MAATPGRLVRHNYTLIKEAMEVWKQRLGEDDFDGTPTELFGYPVQAHHCISCSVIQKHKVARLAKSSGYDINNGNNCIFLPSKFGHMMINYEQRHSGGHWDVYYDYVSEKLDAIYKEYKDADPCKSDEDKKNILSDLKKIENKIHNDLKDRKKWLYDWSEKLYQENYKEEGSGNLKRSNRQGSSSAGLAWADKYPKGKPRRKISKNELYIEWYIKKAFPPPGKITT